MWRSPPRHPAVVSGAAPPREMLTEVGAVTVTWPPWPPPEVPLSIRAPLAMVRVLRLRPMSPAVPAPTVFTEIFAPSLITRDGVVTEIWPAFPVPEVVADSAACFGNCLCAVLTLMFPPAPRALALPDATAAD